MLNLELNPCPGQSRECKCGMMRDNNGNFFKQIKPRNINAAIDVTKGALIHVNNFGKIMFESIIDAVKPRPYLYLGGVLENITRYFKDGTYMLTSCPSWSGLSFEFKLYRPDIAAVEKIRKELFFYDVKIDSPSQTRHPDKSCCIVGYARHGEDYLLVEFTYSEDIPKLSGKITGIREKYKKVIIRRFLEQKIPIDTKALGLPSRKV